MLQQVCGISSLCNSEVLHYNYALTHPNSTPSSHGPAPPTHQTKLPKFRKVISVVAGLGQSGEPFRKAPLGTVRSVAADHARGLIEMRRSINHIFSSERRRVEIRVCLILQVKSGADLEEDGEDWIAENVLMQLISVEMDPETKTGKATEKLKLEKRMRSKMRVIKSVESTQKFKYMARFYVDSDFGLPGAFVMENHHSKEFYLESCTIQIQGRSTIKFPCHSWIYNSSKCANSRVFFSNKAYLPNDTPKGLSKLRQQELASLRGDRKGIRREWDRIYDYDTYNDLGDPDRDRELLRPVLGGSSEHPYPRRCRTGRQHAKTDIYSERPVPAIDQIYIPRDERFLTINQSSDLSTADDSETTAEPAKEITSVREPLREVDSNFFESLRELEDLYRPILHEVAPGEAKSAETLPEQSAVADPDHTSPNYPVPMVIAADDMAWMSDVEFARQTLAGLNPVVIKSLKVFPPESNLDPEIYGKRGSALTAVDLEPQLEGLSVQQAVEQKKLFVLDYYDSYMPFLDRINAVNSVKSYASRTILFLTKQNALTPVAIELSRPSPDKANPVTHRVFLPPATVKEVDWLWQLAKAHVAANDSGYHQLVSHWLRSHATLEPFLIAMHRHLSALHPLNRFLLPHFRNTLSINADARKTLINANGVIEQGFNPGKYSMEMSSAAYKQEWRFDELALPADLIKRGMAMPDAASDHQLKLVIEDYPFAADGLEIWAAIQEWVQDYVQIYYKHDDAVKFDYELQNWWTEARTVGHEDKKNAAGWINMETRANLEEILTIIIWIASAHHAAVNFGQYAYAGFMPNRPTATHKWVPEKNTQEYRELSENPEKYFLSAVSDKNQTTTIMTTLEYLSTHFPEEEYIGQRTTNNWTNSKLALSAFNKFSLRIEAVERLITLRNSSPHLKNRRGSVQLPYTLLYPTSALGVTGMGIPNSVSI
ncbi:hypothetical protein O6H91_05G103500 [Diphasiastrum complanatum]|uniref:Uncharacterized protein n=1 Tax=Diphasiastrum complanatum TaxID=34168 RepID=A0ACC2DRI9_DIPCM|nr:hypothetical protein O6H91_05G103500 [Diphasiastrum complanatum]